MIDGGKIGGRPPSAPRVPEDAKIASKEAASKEAAPKTGKSSVASKDSFTKTSQQSSLTGRAGRAMGADAAGAGDLARLARQDPTAAKALVKTLTSRLATTLNQLDTEKAAAGAVLDRLGKEKFKKEALKKERGNLSKQRNKIRSLHLQNSVALRKLKLLKQIAGKLGDFQLDEEIDQLLSRHRRLGTKWGRRQHLFAAGEFVFSDIEGTPEHLRRVVKTAVRSGIKGEKVAETMGDISPRRLLSELMARTLDGSAPEKSQRDPSALRGEYGRSAQSSSMLLNLLEEAMAEDPFGEGD